MTLIALGSNLPDEGADARSTVLAALDRLGDALGEGLVASRLFRTPAFPAGSGPDFVNAACRCDTFLQADEILAVLHRIEAEAGRVRDRRWGPRVLDLDLIALGDVVLPDPATARHWMDLPHDRQMREAPDQLVVPHPRLQDRSFVLEPLMDIAAEWRHPLTGLTVAQMAAARPAAERAEVVALD